MKAFYEAGDKFYASDYDENIFLKIQESLIHFCMDNDSSFSVEEGKDKKGYYIFLAEKKSVDVDKKPLYSLQCSKKDDLDFAFEVAINQPIVFEGNLYDCDNLSVLRMTMMLKAAEAGFVLPGYWVDGNNNIYQGDVRWLLSGILTEYYKRNAFLDIKYNEILQDIYNADSKECLGNVSFEKLKAVV